MTPDNKNDNPKVTGAAKGKKKRPLWSKVLTACLWTISILVVIVLGIITIAVSYLQPDRLTPMVERYAGTYLNADVKAGRIEISFWSTFPRFDLDIRGLEVRTHAFDALDPSIRSQLPVYADSLLSVGHFNGAISIPRLFSGDIAIHDITIDNPRFNLVQATPEVSGLDIFPPSGKNTQDTPANIPDISLGRFVINGGFPIRYESIPDTTMVTLNLSATSLDGSGNPVYALDIKGHSSLSIPSITISDLAIGIGGDLRWDHENPMAIELDRFKVITGDVMSILSTSLDFTDGLTARTLDYNLSPTPFGDIIALIPESMRGELAKVDADFDIGLDIHLNRPYSIATDSIPSFDMQIKIPDGNVTYDGMRIDQLQLDAGISVDGVNPDLSVVNLRRLFAKGEGMGFELKCILSDLISDPMAKGTFRGGLSVAHLPKKLLAMLPCTVKGLLKANSEFNLRRSYLDREKFHYIKLTGDASLTGLDIDMPELPARIISNHIDLELGTNSSFTRGQQTVDSMLTASMRIDTISCSLPGMSLNGAGLRTGIGTRNTSTSSDTTLINPIGARIVAERLRFRADEDSLRVMLRSATVGASLKRYKENAHQPQLHLDIATRGAMYGDRLNRAFMTNAFTAVTVHPSAPRISPRKKARMDSLQRLYPDLSRDSIYRMATAIGRARRMRRDTSATANDELDIEVDGSIKQLLRKWNAHGILRADRVRMFTPFFPLRNSMSGLNITFDSDSLNIRDTHIRVGHSDFLIEGKISNITRALTAASSRQPLYINLDLSSDTININEIAGAAFAGAAFAENSHGDITIAAPGEEVLHSGNMEEMGNDIVPSDTTAVLVIPSNVEATINIRANHIAYSDLVFRDFHGILSSYEGALNLNSLTARSDIGSLDLNALYSAPNKQEASFAFGLRINDFHIAEFLDLIPAIDSLMPLLHGIQGVINADIAATTGIDSTMNINLPSLKAAVKLSGDSLVVIDDQTFRKIGKWLLFKNKNRNMIDSMNVEMIIDNSQLRMFPFIFNLDRYKLGVMGSNDLALNFNYHIAVLKSPIPFKFGVNVSGNPDNMKIRLGRAKFNEKNMARTVSIADTTRVNLVQEIRNVFRRGVRKARMRRLDFDATANAMLQDADIAGDTISHADSLYFINQGVIPAPDTISRHPDPVLKKHKK